MFAKCTKMNIFVAVNCKNLKITLLKVAFSIANLYIFCKMKIITPLHTAFYLKEREGERERFKDKEK